MDIDKKRFQFFGIDNKTIDKILTIQSQMHILDKGFEVEQSKLYYDDNVDLYNVLKTYTIKSVNENKLADLTAKIGSIFEIYIRNYLNENFHKNGKYIVNPNSLDYNYDNVNVDIDIILYNPNRDLYYFIQCKYTINNKPYYKDEIKSFCHNKLFRKGLKQLSSVDEAIHQNQFIKALNDIGIKLNEKRNNYILILAHTSAQLDFQQIGNVTSYEWNNLRNLLDNGNELIHNMNLTQPMIVNNNISSNLQLENVDSIVDTIMKKSKSQYIHKWNNFINSDFKIELNDLNIVSNIR